MADITHTESVTINPVTGESQTTIEHHETSAEWQTQLETLEQRLTEAEIANSDLATRLAMAEERLANHNHQDLQAAIVDTAIATAETSLEVEELQSELAQEPEVPETVEVIAEPSEEQVEAAEPEQQKRRFRIF
jgi:hypothetical protein